MGSGSSSQNKTDPLLLGGDENSAKSKPRRPAAKKPKTQKSYKDVPKIVPPKSERDRFLEGIDFSYVDDHAMNAPHNILFETFWEVGEYLTDEWAWEDDLVKMRSVFRWVTSYNVRKMKIEVNPPTDSVLEYFSKIQCDIGNHANLFYILCQIVDVPCVVIDGYTKSSAYKIGEKLNKRAIKSQWNAVYIKGNWRLIDVFWATTCVEVNTGDDPLGLHRAENKLVKCRVDKKTSLPHREPVDEYYFFTEPEDFIWTHFPDDPKWQLLPNEKQMKLEEFEKLVYTRERLRELGLGFTHKLYRRVNVQLKQGKGHIELKLPEQKSKHYKFKYALYRPRGTQAIEELEATLNECVKMDQKPDVLGFDFDLPVCGSFNFEVYGKDTKSNELNQFDLCCTYVIRSSVPEKKPLPLPDNPEIGWGPNMKTMVSGIKPITHKRSKIITDDGKLEIKIQGSKECNLQMEIKSAVVDDASITKYAVLRWENGEYIINTRLPKAGHYIMKINVIPPKTQELENVLNYIIKCTGHLEADDPFPNVVGGVIGPTPKAEEMGARVVLCENGLVEAKKGKAKIDIDADEDVLLAHELDCQDPVGVEHMNVNVTRQERVQTYELNLPKAGQYSMNIFGHRESEKGNVKHLFSFLINSTGKPPKRKGNKSDRSLDPSQYAISLPSETPRSQSKMSDFVTRTIRTKDSEVLVPGPDDMTNVMVLLEEVGSQEEPSSDPCQHMRRDGSNWYSVKLTNVGDYLLNVFLRNGNTIKNLMRYKIRRLDIDAADEEKQPNSDSIFKIREQKKAAAVENMKVALDSKNIAQIERSIIETKSLYPGQDHELVEKAEKTIKALEVRRELLSAYEMRHLPTLDRALTKAKGNNYDRLLDPEILLAERLQKRLEMLKALKKEVMMTDVQAITELKRYNQPPDGVYQIMACTLLLLGHPPWEIDTWAKCKGIIGRTGRESLKFKMADFDAREVPLEVALDGKQLIEPYSEKQIREVSPTAAAFHIWNEKQLNEVESTTGTLGTKNFVAEDPGYNNNDDSSPPPQLQTISESESMDNDEQVLPLTKENVNAFDTENDRNRSKVNGHDANAGKRPQDARKTPVTDRSASRPSWYNGNAKTPVKTPVKTPASDGLATSRHYKKMSSGSLPPLVPRKNGYVVTGTKAPVVDRPKSLSPSGSPVLRMNRSYEYRVNKKTGFQHFRKLGIIPDWK